MIAAPYGPLSGVGFAGIRLKTAFQAVWLCLFFLLRFLLFRLVFSESFSCRVTCLH